MNKLAEKIAAVMNDDELEALVDDHYLGESQTLTTGAEQNLLKLAEMRGRMSDEQTKRWEEIKRSYARIQTMGGAEEDPAVRIAGQLGLMSERLGDIGARIAAASAGADGGSPRGESAELAAALAPALERLGQTLATVTAPKETGLSPEAVNAIGAHLGRSPRAWAASATRSRARPRPARARAARAPSCSPTWRSSTRPSRRCRRRAAPAARSSRPSPGASRTCSTSWSTRSRTT